MRLGHLTVSFLGLVALLFAASGAFAGTVTLTNDTQTGKATWTLGTSPDQMTLVLENLTAETETAGDLLTKFRFRLEGVSSISLASATADTVEIDKDGNIAATNSGVDLLTAMSGGKPTWSLDSSDSFFDILFNPDAEFSIIGPPTFGSYSGANGGIKANDGHNPFADGSATFVFDIEGLTESSFALVRPVFYFGTSFENVAAPLPEGVWAGLSLLGAIGLVQIVRRRLRAAAN